jgi:predicted DCC family thiol-disulfide oxidoreductase YuxK
MPHRSHSRREAAVVLFDGNCPLCRRLVRFAQQRDRRRQLEFWPLQSTEGRALLARLGRSPEEIDSIRLVAGVHVSACSDAVLQLGRRLPSPWSWLAIALTLFPRALRDRVYRFVARHRHRLRN